MAIPKQRRGLPTHLHVVGNTALQVEHAADYEPTNVVVDVAALRSMKARGAAAAAEADAKAKADAAAAQRLADLEAEVERLAYDLRMARIENDELRATVDQRVQDATQGLERQLLAERRRNVAGHRLQSILSTDG